MEQLGRDVFHYHLHVVYAPVVVEKKIRWSRRCKDKTLIGNRFTLKPEDWNKVKTLTKEALVLRGRVSDLKRRCKAEENEIQRLKEQQSPPNMLQSMEATQSG